MSDYTDQSVSDLIVNKLTLAKYQELKQAGSLQADQLYQITDPESTSETASWGLIDGTLSNQIDLNNALNAKYDASNPNGYTSNAGTVTSVNNVSPVNGNVSLSIPTVNNATLTITQGGTTKGTFTANASSNVTIALDSGGGTVDQTYNATSANAQSGIAINGAGFLKNTATGSNAVTILGNITTAGSAVNIGYGSSVGGGGGVAIGRVSSTSGSFSTALGYSAKASANYAIQLGYGTNSTASTLAVGFNNTNYQLLDGTTGLIPDDRISSNIARSSDIPTVTDTYNSTSSDAMSGKAVASAISGKQDTLVSGTSIKTINSTSLLGSGDISITGLPSQTSQSGKFLTTNGTTASWSSAPSPSIDSKSITTNGSSQLQTVGIINQRDTTAAVKIWVGTEAQYSAITTKDANTLYFKTES